jgi:hypothetical protein
MPRHTSTVMFALAAVLAAPVTPHAQQPDAVALVNVTVIPMDRERTVPEQTVIVRDGRIEAFGPAATVTAADRRARQVPDPRAGGDARAHPAG